MSHEDAGRRRDAAGAAGRHDLSSANATHGAERGLRFPIYYTCWHRKGKLKTQPRCEVEQGQSRV